jgi:hypothetical protein
MRNDNRAGADALSFSAAPYAIPIFLSVSLRSGKLKLYFSANFLFASTESKLMP